MGYFVYYKVFGFMASNKYWAIMIFRFEKVNQ